MLPLATGEFDGSTIFAAIGTSLGGYGTAGLALLAVSLSILIGLKWGKKIANKTT